MRLWRGLRHDEKIKTNGRGYSPSGFHLSTTMIDSQTPATIPHATLADVARDTDARLTIPARNDAASSARVLDVTHDSRQVAPGSLFAAIRGAVSDAHDFIPGAIERGAVGVISERDAPIDTRIAWFAVADARRALARAARVVHGDPSARLPLVGVTGTNGKTTVAYIVSHIAEVAGATPALLGTIERRIGSMREPTEHTTPEASDTQRFLRRALEAGCRVAVMECSSQALDLHRCDALRFAVAVWTNLTQDHLDYHGDMETYYRSKLRLFDGSLGVAPGHSVVNSDDAHGRRLHDEIELTAGGSAMTYALDAAADVRADDVRHTPGGMSFRLHTPAGKRVLHSPLAGRPMLYNILAASCAALALGFDLDDIARGVETCAGAPGRFERVAHAGDFAVVVDYAHTPDAITNTLRTAREIVTEGRVIVVFGCGGDRDRAKRPLMGAAAAEGGDLVILTSDNPRTEDPEQIFRDTEEGLRSHETPYSVEPDRRAAIFQAIAAARSGDIVIIAGKGHETYQIIGTEREDFDDREVAREALAARKL